MKKPPLRTVICRYHDLGRFKPCDKLFHVFWLGTTCTQYRVGNQRCNQRIPVNQINHRVSSSSSPFLATANNAASSTPVHTPTINPITAPIMLSPIQPTAALESRSAPAVLSLSPSAVRSASAGMRSALSHLASVLPLPALATAP